MPHPDQHNVWGVEEETLRGDVGRFREATGMRQCSGVQTGGGDWSLEMVTEQAGEWAAR